MPRSTDDMSDAELMLEVADGITESAGVLFTRYSDRLYRYFYSMTRSRDDSMDAVQDVFARLIRYGHSFRGGIFVAWIFRIARNVANDRYRRSGVETAPAVEIESVDSAPLPDGRVELIEAKRLLEEALTRISPAYREVLLLSRYADLSYKEIGVVLDCSGDAVKVRVHRALTSLRKNYLELSRERNEL